MATSDRRFERKPSWLRVRAPAGERYRWIKSQRRELGLATVCEEAACPNIGECWSGGTATFMVMGSICTRGCRFCNVNTKRRGLPLDPDEPAKLAETIRQMALDYIVITSVDRDDLPDQGADHFRACVQAVKEVNPELLVEILIPDFRGDEGLVARCAHSGAEVVAHNIETVRRLTPRVRDPRAGYDQSLEVLRTLKAQNPEVVTKSSIMVGLGESPEEVLSCMEDLRQADCQILTLGQYLRPTPKHLAVEEYVTPEQFRAYEEHGKELGFRYVASGPLVRSSYRAAELFLTGMLRGVDGSAPDLHARPRVEPPLIQLGGRAAPSSPSGERP